MFEEAILVQTESILESEIKKAAADVVTNSLAAMSLVPLSKSDPEGSEKSVAQEKILVNINTNWEEITFLVDFLIESIPDNVGPKDCNVKK